MPRPKRAGRGEGDSVTHSQRCARLAEQHVRCRGHGCALRARVAGVAGEAQPVHRLLPEMGRREHVVGPVGRVDVAHERPYAAAGRTLEHDLLADERRAIGSQVPAEPHRAEPRHDEKRRRRQCERRLAPRHDAPEDAARPVASGIAGEDSVVVHNAVRAAGVVVSGAGARVDHRAVGGVGWLVAVVTDYRRRTPIRIGGVGPRQRRRLIARLEGCTGHRARRRAVGGRRRLVRARSHVRRRIVCAHEVVVHRVVRGGRIGVRRLRRRADGHGGGRGDGRSEVDPAVDRVAGDADVVGGRRPTERDAGVVRRRAQTRRRIRRRLIGSAQGDVDVARRTGEAARSGRPDRALQEHVKGETGRYRHAEVAGLARRPIVLVVDDAVGVVVAEIGFGALQTPQRRRAAGVDLRPLGARRSCSDAVVDPETAAARRRHVEHGDGRRGRAVQRRSARSGVERHDPVVGTRQPRVAELHVVPGTLRDQSGGIGDDRRKVRPDRVVRLHPLVRGGVPDEAAVGAGDRRRGRAEADLYVVRRARRQPGGRREAHGGNGVIVGHVRGGVGGGHAAGVRAAPGGKGGRGGGEGKHETEEDESGDARSSHSPSAARARFRRHRRPLHRRV